IIVAGIQSVYRRAAELDRFDLILIDEAHMLPPDGEGMYRTFRADAKVVNPNVRLIGLTATPYRMTSGMICAPENLLNHVCYEVGVRELIVQGYLCPLKTKAGRRKVDTSGLHVRGGEFIAGEVEALMDDDSLVRSACREIVDHTRERHSVLIFASGVQHALHVQRVLGECGHECGFVCGETLPFERTETLRRFKVGDLKYLVNVNVLTTGFDAPNIDCVALLRPTMSPGLYYQMVGRGFRLDPSKVDCLVLDFGGNILRHGPVDALQVDDRAGGNGEAPAKECPQCQAVIHAAYATCPECGHEFPPPEREKHDHQASTAGILSGEVTETEYPVTEVYYSVHHKRDAPEDHPRTLRIDYRCGFNDYHSEWVCPEHTGYARQKFEAWWRARSNEPFPDSVEEAVELAEAGALAPVQTITVRSVAGEKFDRISDYQLGPIPPRLDGGDERIDNDVPEPVWPEDDIPF
ncbi:MAG: helicase-related protein, partial [Planctomycetota bacterium]|nr:helicase-related protein [Planctomycetota bacterium]